MEIVKLDKELVHRLKRGDMVAFDAIYSIYCHKLYRFVLRYVKQKEDAEGVVQEVFIKVWDSRNRIDLSASFESFVFTIAYNTTISLLRKRVTDVKYRDYLMSLNQIELEDTSVVDEQFNDLKESVQLLLNNLTSRQKEIFLLSRSEGLTHKEIAKKLNITENTVKNHLVTALKYLRTHVDRSRIFGVLFFCLFIH